MNGTQTALLKATLANIPQAQAISIVKSSVSSKDMAQQIIQAAAIQSLTAEQQQAITAFMLLDKDARVALAGQLIGTAVATKAGGFFSKIMSFFSGMFG